MGFRAVTDSLPVGEGLTRNRIFGKRGESSQSERGDHQGISPNIAVDFENTCSSPSKTLLGSPLEKNP